MTQRPPLSITIIGGGFAGTVTAIKLLEQSDTPVAVTVVESRDDIGRGSAYSTPDPVHLVNGPARIFGLHPERPDHLVEWLRIHGPAEGWELPQDVPNASPPRWLYGSYVRAELDRAVAAAAGRSTFRREQGRAERLERGSHGWTTQVAGNAAIHSDQVVLATGVFQQRPTLRESELMASGRYLHDLWQPEALDRLASAGHLLLVGSSLSMVDAIAGLERRGYRGRYTVVSRRGQVVDARQVEAVEPWRDFLGEQAYPRSAVELLRRVKAERRAIARAGLDWQGLPLSIKPHLKALWQGASNTERMRFARHLRAFWDVTAHRAAPESYAAVERVRADARFESLAGRVVSMRESINGVDVGIRLRRSGGTASLQVDAVVNCRGQQLHDWRRIEDAFVRHLINEGVVRPHATGFGIDATPAGEVIDAQGSVQRGLDAIGHPLRGVAWESSSIGEQLAQAIALASRLTALATVTP